MDWKGRRVVIVGAARQGTALAEYLARRGAQVLLTDQRGPEHFADAQARLTELDIDWRFGEPALDWLDEADMLCLSGGVSPEIPLARKARAREIPLSNDSQLFLKAAPCPVIGITGSAGKTTTTILVGRILRGLEGVSFRKVWVGGNVGNPLITDVDKMAADDLAVMELSSFQLELMSRAPHIAAVLNLAPNHLDRHGTMAAYVAAKARILDFQSADDIAILNREDRGAWTLKNRVQGHLWSFGTEEPPTNELGSFVRSKQIWLRGVDGEQPILPFTDIELRGAHNRLNVLAAVAISAAAGAGPEEMRAGVIGFKGAPHRLEWVAQVNGVDWYNDSIATSPQRAEASLASFERPVVLLAGGRDKGLDWESFAALAAQRATRVVAFGEAAPMIQELFAAKSVDVHTHASFEAAVAAAAALAKKGDVVLLAPGGTSFDEFEDFEARGRRFRDLVSAL